LTIIDDTLARSLYKLQVFAKSLIYPTTSTGGRRNHRTVGNYES